MGATSLARRHPSRRRRQTPTRARPQPAPDSPPVTVPAPNTSPASSPQATPQPSPTPAGGVNIAADDPSTSSIAMGPRARRRRVARCSLRRWSSVLVLKARRRGRRRRRPDPADAITGAWREAMDSLADHRVLSSPAETPLELARRVPDVAGDETGPPLQVLARAYTATRYGDSVPPTDSAATAWSAVDALRRALDASGSARDRLRARFAPGTLRREPHTEHESMTSETSA